ncbi:MAG: HD family phosphohydrolase [Flavobacteriaceae bacterium]
MKSIWNYLVRQQRVLYKSLLLLSSSLFILSIFPLGVQFKYEFQKGKVWQYPDFYAPFDFSILKSEAELNNDEAAVLNELKPYFRADLNIKEKVFEAYPVQFERLFGAEENTIRLDSLYEFGSQLLQEIYVNGVLAPNEVLDVDQSIFLIQGQIELALKGSELFRSEQLFSFISQAVEKTYFTEYENLFKDLFFDLIVPNVALDRAFYELEKQQALQNISRSRGFVAAGELIITKGARVDDKAYEKLYSIKQELTLQQDGQNSSWIVFGYSILIVLTFTLLLIFLHTYRFEIYSNNKKLTFIFFNIVIVLTAVTFTLNYNTDAIFAVPICILPLIIKAFFDARLGLFTHLLTVLLIGFIVPNSFEFVFLQITAGIVTIQSVAQLYRRANLFISVGQIVLVYFIGYISFTSIQEGTLLQLNPTPLFLFLLNGLLMLFVQPMIYIYERLFGLVSDVSLLELTDTNTPLLKELSDKAPGTFHHSLQVANLAEAAANEIGANALLVRVGALYHDIGKLKAPSYFSENQTANYSPHEKLKPMESAELIINHVDYGVTLAEKYKLPDRIIDFIKTHHGTSTVYFFYKKQEELTPGNVQKEAFSYKGPKPFSKETAILMMADAVEAASKSLKSPNVEELEEFVDKIIEGKKEEQQFESSDITFAEISAIKNVLFKKLINVYQLRIEYPE